MTDVLISYARRDRGVAARLATSLAAHGLKAVWDIADLPDGALRSAARARLHAAPAIVVLWSEASAHSPWVQEEADLALSRDALVSAAIDATKPPVLAAHQSIDLSAWNVNGDEAALDALIKAIAQTAQRSHVSAEAAQPDRAPVVGLAPALPTAPTEPEPPQPASENPVEINDGAPPGETAAVTAFIIIAFLTLLSVAVARKDARTPVALPPVSMDATEPLDVTIIPPTPQDENAPSGLRPNPVSPQDSTGSVRK